MNYEEFINLLGESKVMGLSLGDSETEVCRLNNYELVEDEGRFLKYVIDYACIYTVNGIVAQMDVYTYLIPELTDIPIDVELLNFDFESIYTYFQHLIFLKYNFDFNSMLSNFGQLVISSGPSTNIFADLASEQVQLIRVCDYSKFNM